MLFVIMLPGQGQAEVRPGRGHQEGRQSGGGDGQDQWAELEGRGGEKIKHY